MEFFYGGIIDCRFRKRGYNLGKNTEIRTQETEYGKNRKQRKIKKQKVRHFYYLKEYVK
jgi:hypothetical protein